MTVTIGKARTGRWEAAAVNHHCVSMNEARISKSRAHIDDEHNKPGAADNHVDGVETSVRANA